VLDHPLGSQHLVQVVKMRSRDCLEHGVSSSGHLDVHGTGIDATGEATNESDVCLDQTGNIAHHLCRHLLALHTSQHAPARLLCAPPPVHSRPSGCAVDPPSLCR
jgi:hypothetical protein